MLTGGGSYTCSLGQGVRDRRGCVFEFPTRGCLTTYNSCPLLPRVLESLLVSLVTTVVVFVASMVLGECRQMSSSHIGNDSLLLQVTPVYLLPLSCIHSKACLSELKNVLGSWLPPDQIAERGMCSSLFT